MPSPMLTPYLMFQGPNASGKTILMDQTALIVIMAHIGCYVPAEYSRMCYIDQVSAPRERLTRGTWAE